MMASESSSVKTVTDKINSLIELTKDWGKELNTVSESQITALNESKDALQEFTKAASSAVDQTQELLDKIISSGKAAEDTVTQLKRVNAEYKSVISSAATPYDPKLLFGLNQIQATGTIQQKAAFDWEDSRINEIYKIMARMEALQNNRGTNPTGIDLKDYLAYLRAREVEERFRTAEQKAIVDKYEAARKADEAELQKLQARYQELDKEIKKAQLSGEINSIELDKKFAGQMESYSPADLLKLFSEASARIPSWSFNSDISNKLQQINTLLSQAAATNPTKKYQLDLTIGSTALTGFTDVSPQRFLEALANAKLSSFS